MNGVTAAPLKVIDAPRRSAAISTLQIGLEWFPDGLVGGCGRYFSTLTDHLASAQVGVQRIAAGRAISARPRSDGTHIICAHDAPLLKRVGAARAAVREILAQDRVDVVASHFALYPFACLDLMKRLPLVVHFHGPWAAESQLEGASQVAASGKFLIEKVVYSRAERAIALTNAFAGVMHRTYGVPLEKIAVIPGGVDVERFSMSQPRATARMQLGLPVDQPIVVVARRLVKRMGIENLIASFAAVRRTHKDAVLAIVGSGNLADALKRQAHDYDLLDGVRFPGRVSEDDLVLYYRAADFTIVPSIALEGFGLAVAESLACGTPALVTPVGGLPEVVSGLSESLTLEGSDCAAITKGLSAALSGELRLPSAEACARYARARFSWPIVAERVTSVYREVL